MVGLRILSFEVVGALLATVTAADAVAADASKIAIDSLHWSEERKETSFTLSE